MNTRRNLLIVLGSATLMPRLGFAQSKPQVLIGWLNTDSRELSGQYLIAFKEALAALGWKEGAQFVIEERWANGRIDQLQPLAEELAAKSPAIMIAALSGAVFAAARAAPRTPIVIANSEDPVALGLVKSLSRPGGLITGLTNFSTTILEKYLEFLLAAAPKVKRIGFLSDASNPGRVLRIEAARRSVAQYRVEARFAEVANAAGIEPAMSRLAQEGAQGLIVLGGLTLRNQQRRIVALALAQGWPMVAETGSWTEAGALLSYGADALANYRRAAYYADRILRGTKPSDLPIEQPTTFEFVVNLKTAKALGLTIPPEIMVRADRLIE